MVKLLSFEEQPEYNKYKQLFQGLLNTFSGTDSNQTVFDWSKKKQSIKK